MKKLYTLVTLLFIIFLNIDAQNRFSLEYVVLPQESFVIGDVTQFTSSTNSPGGQYTSFNKKFTIGMAAGIKADYKLNDGMCISVGALYSHQGQNFDSLGTDFKDYYQVSLNYLKMPILFHFKIPKNKIAFSFYGGAYMAFLFNYEIDSYESVPNRYEIVSGDLVNVGGGYVSATTTGNTLTEFNSATDLSYSYNLINKPFSTFDFGLMAGAGIEIKLVENVIVPVMINYDVGLTNMKNDNAQAQLSGQPFYYWGDTSNPNRTGKWHNSTLGLTIGLKVNI